MKNKTWCVCIAVTFALFCMCSKSNPAKGNDTTTFTLTVGATNGTVAKSPNLAAYDSNSVVQLTATPATGYHFTGWSGDTTETANPMNIRMNGNKNITANFAINTYSLTVNAGTGGSVTPSGTSIVNHGAATSITATPGVGYNFVRWTRTSSAATITDSNATSTTVALTADDTVSAVFARKQYTLSASATNGGVTKSPDQPLYDSNTVVTLTANASTGYHFTGWTGDLTGSGNPDSMRMDASKNVIAKFAINTYTLTVNAGAGGTVSPTGAYTVNYGAATPITAIPDSGYRFVRWTRSGTGATIADSTRASTTVSLTADATITAEFAINHAPNKPSNPSPIDGATDQNKSLVLSWTGGDVDAGDTVKYDVYLSTINPPATKVSSAQIGTVYNVSGLSVNTTYYWYVLAADGKSTTPGGVWHFTTLSSFPDGMKLIPGGTFQMGSTNGNSDERPVHQVTLSAFYMDTTEVTQADYVALMLVNPSYFDSGSTWPVESVTWFDAVLYCNARSKNNGMDTVYTFTSISGTPGDSCWSLGILGIDYTKNGYRLPTEAEWEYACRAGSTTDYYWGGSYPPTTTADTAAIDNNAVWPHNSNYSTAKVGTKLPNAWGLYDMNGNVWEWCNDWYSGSYYSVSPLTDPTGPTGSYLYRVMRGGSWHYSNYDAGYFRSAYRSNNDPVHKGIGDGFRCVRR